MSTPTKATPRLYPIQALQNQIVTLDAAMLVAVTSTEEGAVHKLRTATRRVQAHLTLVDLVSAGAQPIPVPEETSAVLRRLRRVRRAAGTVRDLDVQAGIIRTDAPQKAAVHKGTPGDAVRKQAKKLRKALEAKRDAEAKMLVHTLQQEEQELAAELLALEQTLKPVKRRAISASSLVDRVTRYFARSVEPVLHQRGKRETDLRHRIEAMHEEDLHTVRKLAKMCRYMLESAGTGTVAQPAAERFEALQEAGGRWHDWLLLQHLSDRFHGRKAELTQRYRVHMKAALAEYYLQLNDLLPSLMGQ